LDASAFFVRIKEACFFGFFLKESASQPVGVIGGVVLQLVKLVVGAILVVGKVCLHVNILGFKIRLIK
jgi:hypothetical protein